MTAKTVAGVLEAAADLLEKPGAWTRHVFARNSAGMPVSTFSDSATCFCLRGALCRVGGFMLSDEMTKIQAALGFPNAKAMADWNDYSKRTQAEVVARLRNRAAILAGAQS